VHAEEHAQGGATLDGAEVGFQCVRVFQRRGSTRKNCLSRR
jgi:hypothetical protein